LGVLDESIRAEVKGKVAADSSEPDSAGKTNDVGVVAGEGAGCCYCFAGLDKAPGLVIYECNVGQDVRVLALELYGVLKELQRTFVFASFSKCYAELAEGLVVSTVLIDYLQEAICSIIKLV
jgi:hypothetical protein